MRPWNMVVSPGFVVVPPPATYTKLNGPTESVESLEENASAAASANVLVMVMYSLAVG